MPLLVVILGGVLIQPPGPLQAAWQFRPGHEFYVEETHRQLLTVRASGPPVSTYIDYSAIFRYRVRTATFREATVESTVEKVRINNPNEAGAKAVEAIKAREKNQTTWRLTHADQGWQADSVPPAPEAPPPIFLTLGTRQGTDAQSWQQTWTVPSPAGPVAVRMNGRVRPNNTPPVVRVELRPEWVAAHHAAMSIRPLPTETAGIGIYHRAQGRWEYADFRLRAIFRTSRNGEEVELRQDLTSYYRYFDTMPSWQ
jgi:hypothetical protein